MTSGRGLGIDHGHDRDGWLDVAFQQRLQRRHAVAGRAAAATIGRFDQQHGPAIDAQPRAIASIGEKSFGSRSNRRDQYIGAISRASDSAFCGSPSVMTSPPPPMPGKSRYGCTRNTLVAKTPSCPRAIWQIASRRQKRIRLHPDYHTHLLLR